MASSAWDSLVHRSVKAWDSLTTNVRPIHEAHLQKCSSLDEFLSEGTRVTMFWFFQRREAFMSQKSMPKWSSDRLDDYVLLPAANGYVQRSECFFVSHFWLTKDHPDPDGKYLKLLQEELRPQAWSYVWIDWTCTPQDPRSPEESSYFLRTMQTMSGIIRNCGFIWYYPPFEARLWILYEVAEATLTSTGEVPATEDAETFVDHVEEMLQVGVRPTLEKHGYKCTYDRDKEYLTSWLELLVLLRKLNMDVDEARRVLDHLTWFPSVGRMYTNTINGLVQIFRFEGVLILNGKTHDFTPFPRWQDGKFSTKATPEPA